MGLILLAKVNLLFLPLSFIIIAGLQVHLSILLHEGAHYNLHPNKKVNEFLSDLFTAAPLLTLTKFYRALHLTHHRYTSSEELDPERPLFRYMGFNYEKLEKKAFFVMLLKDLCGINVTRYALWLNKFVFGLQKQKKLDPINLQNVLAYVVFLGGWLALFSSLGCLGLSVLLWLGPLFTLTFALIKLHAHGEHYFTPSEDEFKRTLTREYNVFATFFIYPLNSGLHLEHHLYPTVPWYNLRKLKTICMQDPTYRQGAEKVTVTGFFLGEKSIYKELVK